MTFVSSAGFAVQFTGGGLDQSSLHTSGTGTISRDVTLTGNRTTAVINNYANSQNPTIDNVSLKRIA
jgi:hypothetical protein